MTQEFHLSVTPIRDDEYLVRTENVAPGVPLAEEQVIWHVDDWLMEASLLMGDPLLGFLSSQNPLDISNLLSGSSTGANSGKLSANLVAFGRQLHNSLFQGTIRDSWMMAKGIAQHQRQRLRFRLGLKGTQLHRLPWEVLYDGDRPLATGTDVLFSRYHSSFSVLKSHLAFQKSGSAPHQPLKILMVLAAPSDQDVLALKQEAQQLQQELQTLPKTENGLFSGIELTILEQPGREQLTQALEHNHYQVLHYAGHSDLGGDGGSIYLVSSKTGLTEVLSGDDLAGLLVNNGIRMAVFNSCRGGYTANADSQAAAEGNLAEALVRRGIPAVLAMAERIPDDVALNLSRLFYRNLKQSYPVDLSLSRARQGLISSYGSDQLYWALPILYLHPEFDGNLHPLTIPISNNSSPAYWGVASQESTHSTDPWAVASDPAATVAGMASSDSNWERDWAIASGAASAKDEYQREFAIAEGDLHSFEDIEFEDPDPPEEETVDRLVYEVSQSPTLLEGEEPVLSASASESLLPKPKASDTSNGNFYPPTSPNSYLSSAQNGKSVAPKTSLTAPQAHEITESNGDARMYSELQNVLEQMGTLTPEIAASNRAIQMNPNSADAYTDFGWALYQQGYLNEAISAYNQAIRLDAGCAKAFNRLGLAFYQQGKTEEAVRAYSRAVQLDPTLTEASTNLKAVLYGEPIPPTFAPLPGVLPDLPAATSLPSGKRRPWLLWGGIGVIAAVSLLGGWFYHKELMNLLIRPSEPTVPAPDASQPGNALNPNLEPAAIAAIATQHLQNRDLPAAQTAITTLLNNNKISEADTVLKAVPTEIADTPTIYYLNGRVAWHRWLAGESGATLEAARQLWEKASKEEQTPLNQTALGFAYYAEGKVDQAERVWLNTLKLSGTPLDANSAGTTATPKPEALTANAGLALTAMKQAKLDVVSKSPARLASAVGNPINMADAN